MANPIVHVEIMGTEDNKQRLQAFYRDTFDWQIDPTGEIGYGLLVKPEGEPGPEAAVDASPTGPSVVVFIGVDDIRAAVAKVQANGGELVTDVTTVPGMVTYAQFRDPAGNMIGLMDNETPPA